jgi:hypothetical protein
VQTAGADAGTRRRLARHAVAGGHEGIGAVVDVEQRALGAFEQQVAARLVDRVEVGRNIGDHRTDLFGIGHRLVEDRLKIHRLGAQVLGQHEVVIFEVLGQLFGKALRIEEVIDRSARRATLSS